MGLNLEVFENNKVYVVADTHFGHKNVIEYESRPFDSVEEMDITMINNWNSVVNPDDIVYFLGDFAFYSRERLVQIGKQLNGYKILVKGNHDRGNNNLYRKAGFSEIHKKPIIIGDLVLSHVKIPCSELGVNQINIHGHSHSKGVAFSKQYKCVSVENINYTPIEIQTLLDNF